MDIFMEGNRGAGWAPCRRARAARAGKWAVEITAALG